MKAKALHSVKRMRGFPIQRSKKMYTIKEYYSGRKRWAVFAPNGEMLCVCLYKKGATCLVAHLNELVKTKEVK